MAQEIINGVPHNFGIPPSPLKKGAVIADDGVARTVCYEFTYADLPTNSTTDVGVHNIPAYASIVESRLIVETAFAGGTDYQIGVVQADGTAIDVDGFHTAAATVLANLTPKGKTLVGGGALVGAGIGSAAGQVKVTASGTFTAGKAHLYVKYIPTPFA
jgi:hypothetical protein